MHSPTEKHLSVVHKILLYLKMTPKKGFFFFAQVSNEELKYILMQIG